MVVNLNSNIRFYPVIFGIAKVDRFFLTTKIYANYFQGMQLNCEVNERSDETAPKID